MIYDNDIALQTARFLLQIKAIKLNYEQPFQWASGWLSPIYCDNRKVLSYPRIRTYIRENIAKIISEKFGDIDAIAGVATGGIAMGVLVAQQLDKPFVYIRPQKEHGLKNSIEGVLQENSRVIVIEDLVSTGKSSLFAVKVLRENQANIKGMISIFDYGFDVARENFEKEDCQLISLSNYDALLEESHAQGDITASNLTTLTIWKTAPEKWGR